ncbi:MAG: nucleotidyltransferase domain-containing protein [Chloroflexi bacterium]|nr:nucleotidyltransferase domain-containing protein [Chloroflexota bacterium]
MNAFIANIENRRDRALLPDLDSLANVFGKYPDIQAVYLFGSVAEGRTHVESDMDLAIVPRLEFCPPLKLDVLADLARIGFCDVDLVILDTDDIVLLHEAVRQNNVIYQTEEFDRGAFYSMVVRRYLDFQPYLMVQRHALKSRILHGQS